MAVDFTSDLDVLARTIYGESRGEPLLGKQGVAATVVNRALYAATHHYPMFGDGMIRAACIFPWQYSCWNKNDPNYPKILALDLASDDPVIHECLAVAQSAVDGDLADPTHGAMWYKTNALPWPHVWGPEVQPLIVIYDQSFYNLITEQPLVS
jgi:N-acetylmuramoyl-L-alanine amidase